MKASVVKSDVAQLNGNMLSKCALIFQAGRYDYTAFIGVGMSCMMQAFLPCHSLTTWPSLNMPYRAALSST